MDMPTQNNDNGLTTLLPDLTSGSKPLLSLFVKQTYTLKKGAPALLSHEQQIPFYKSDTLSPYTQEGDFSITKPGTDVIITGTAYVPKGRQATQLKVGAQIGERQKSLAVFGKRHVCLTPWGFKFTSPQPFSQLPLNYEWAYGGCDANSDPGREYLYPKNPRGKGFIVKPQARALQGLELPCIENPACILTPQNLVIQKYKHWLKAPSPANLGCIPKNFYPRYTLVSPEGSLNPEFFHHAQPEFQWNHFKGNEPVRLIHMDPDLPEFDFYLPLGKPQGWLDTGNRVLTQPLACKTIEILKDQDLLTLLWQGIWTLPSREFLENLDTLEYGFDENVH